MIIFYINLFPILINKIILDSCNINIFSFQLKMQISRITKSQRLQHNHQQSSPQKQIRKMKKNLVNVSNSQKKLSPTPKHHHLQSSHIQKLNDIDQNSNSTQQIRITGFQKLLYIKKCRQKKRNNQEIFANYPFSKMDSYTFKESQIRDELGKIKAQIIQDSQGLHLVQQYKHKSPDNKYSSIHDVQGKFNGISVSIFNDGSIFQGIYHDGHYCGMGYELQQNGNTYIGSFKDGVKNGNGTFYWFTNNEFFSGQWHGGLPHGQGVYINGDSKDRYEGMFSNGLKYGFGTQLFSNGDKYIGEYINGVAQGYGQYFWKDGSIYKGDFKHGVRHGYGIWRDEKEIYQGNYRMDKKQGIGIYKWIGKQIYKGEFRDDFRQGYGQFYNLNKSQKQTLVYKGCWLQGKKWQDGKVDQKKLKQLYSFLDQSYKLQKQLQNLSKKNQGKTRIGHKNCIPHQNYTSSFKT